MVNPPLGLEKTVQPAGMTGPVGAAGVAGAGGAAGVAVCALCEVGWLACGDGVDTLCLLQAISVRPKAKLRAVEASLGDLFSRNFVAAIRIG